MSTPRSLDLPDQVRPVTIRSLRGRFAALEAWPATGVCERRPAVLLPGFTGSKEDFIPVLRPLASAGRRVVAVDMRGQYQSEGAPDPAGYAPAGLAADVAAIAAAVADDGGSDRQRSGPSQAADRDTDRGVHLVGHSLGGLVAREAALAGRTRMISLTLLGSGPGRISGQRAELLRAMLALMDAGEGAAGGGAPGGGPPSEERLRVTVGEIWHDHLEPQARADGVPAPVIAFLRRRMMGNSPTGLMAMGRYLLACPDRTAELARLGGPPILVLYGENDDAWRPAVQERMARRLGAHRVCIPGAGHSPAVEAPETTASALTAFWRSAEDNERRASGRQPGRAASNGSGSPAASSPAVSPPAESSPAASSPAASSPAPSPSPSHGRRGSEAALPSGQQVR